MSSSRRSNRRVPPVTYRYDDSIYPDCPPSTTFENDVHSLNLQAFNSSSLISVDDRLTFVHFSTKRKSQDPRAFHLEKMAGDQTEVQTGIAIANVIREGISFSEPTATQCREVSERLCQQFSSIFEHADLALIEQQVACL
jgi:hypothetical protein